MSKVAVYPGTFDPITLGHQDIIGRASKMFDKVIVAVANHTHKKSMFDHEVRIDLVKHVTYQMKNVEVLDYNGLLVEFAKQKNADVIIRGLRNVSDVAIELPMATMNRTMVPELETIFMAPAEKYLALSSSLVRDVIQYKGDYSQFVDPIVANKIILKKEM